MPLPGKLTDEAQQSLKEMSDAYNGNKEQLDAVLDRVTDFYDGNKTLIKNSQFYNDVKLFAMKKEWNDYKSKRALTDETFTKLGIDYDFIKENTPTVFAERFSNRPQLIKDITKNRATCLQQMKRTEKAFDDDFNRLIVSYLLILIRISVHISVKTHV